MWNDLYNVGLKLTTLEKAQYEQLDYALEYLYEEFAKVYSEYIYKKFIHTRFYCKHTIDLWQHEDFQNYKLSLIFSISSILSSVISAISSTG